MQNKTNPLVSFSVLRPKTIIWFLVAITFALGAFIPKVTVDTDPENMLAKTEPVRVFHDKMKKEFSLSDMIVLGIVNESHKQGVFNPRSLANIYELTQYAKTLRWKRKDAPGKFDGVIEVDILAPSTVDNIKQGGLGVVRFEWLMKTPPATQAQALDIRKQAERIPFLNGTLLSEDGKALCLYLPLTSKDMSYKVSVALQKKIKTLKGNDQYFITGLPVAEDTFGVEMFKQMAISAPLAMLIIFILLWVFFKKFQLIISPMLVALCSVITTMGLLIGTGNTVHIMSSMIPIFIMPIAVLDSIHILSEFFELYQRYKDRKQTLLIVMKELFTPMLYTSLTSAAGFGSLALTPIPPVQVFGIFVAVGIMFAWLLTITVIPAYIMLMPQKSLDNFGVSSESEHKSKGGLAPILKKISIFTVYQAKPIILFMILAIVLAIYGISRIQINDNPIRWFKKTHSIRIADRVLNKHFGGTYMAYLLLQAPEEKESVSSSAEALLQNITDSLDKLKKDGYPVLKIQTVISRKIQTFSKTANNTKEFISSLQENIEKYSENASDDELDVWDNVIYCIEAFKQRDEVFKRPDVLSYILQLQHALQETQVVGKSNSIADIVKTVHRELLLGKDEEFRIPDTKEAVAQCLLTYQNSHRPNDLWHLVTPDYTKTSIWVQLRSGDNKDMSKVVDFMDKYIKRYPPPIPLSYHWFGASYINIFWQDKMVKGMLSAFLGSFLVVFLMMSYLFRSVLWGFLCMIPLTVTIAFIYGTVGLIGKDYDMPIAVLSSLTLGLAVDFAIHFLVRARELFLKHKNWKLTVSYLFDEPALAIARNIIVIAVGFLPLIAAPLMPYKTVGVFLATILAVSGIATLFLLPALITLFQKTLFGQIHSTKKMMCGCVSCIIMTVSFVILVLLNLRRFLPSDPLTWILIIIGIIILAAGLCCILKKRFSSCNK